MASSPLPQCPCCHQLHVSVLTAPFSPSSSSTLSPFGLYICPLLPSLPPAASQFLKVSLFALGLRAALGPSHRSRTAAVWLGEERGGIWQPIGSPVLGEAGKAPPPPVLMDHLSRGEPAVFGTGTLCSPPPRRRTKVHPVPGVLALRTGGVYVYFKALHLSVTQT